jgi:tetratricopeptide (TPR) repeat protein
MTRRLALLLSLPLLLAAVLPCWADAFSDHYREALDDLWAKRAGPSAIVSLYEADDLLDVVDSSLPFEEALRRVAQAPDADPEVRAHALARLALLLRDRGEVAEAAALEGPLGYVSRWRVVGPFDDESKVGFEAEYPPEKDGAFQGSYEGKGHSVAWKDVPVAVERGVVPLDQLLDPGDKVAGYAASFVWVAKDTACVLRGGYNEAYKVWVDGEEAGERKSYNGRAFDQYADACTLRKGWNVILVKVCNQDAGWNFSLRITDAEGRGLTDFKAASDPKGLGEPLPRILAKDGRPPAGFRAGDPELTLAQRAEKGEAKALEEYGLYLSYLRCYDRSDDKPIQMLRRAATSGAKDPWAWVALGDVENDHNRRREAYEMALTASPGFSPALERLARHYLNRGQPFPAMDFVRRGLAGDPESPLLQALQASIEMGYASDGLAARRLASLYTAHPQCTAVARTYQEALRALGRREEAAEVQSRLWARTQSDPDAWMGVLSEFVSTGRPVQALDLLAKMRARFPLERGVPFRWASYLLSQNRAGDAVKVLDPCLAWCGDWPEMRKLYGDLLEASGKPEEALAQYQQALILKPQMEEVKRKVAFLKPEEEGFETAYRIDLKDLPQDLGPFSGQQAVFLVDNTAVKVEPNGLSSRYVQKVIQVVKSAAAQQLQSWPITFDPDQEEVRVLDASILKPDGRRVHADTMVTDAVSDPQYRLYYRNRNLVLLFSSLAEGDRIWIEYKVSGVGEQNQYGQYFGDLVPFAGSVPILMKQYTLVLPESFPLHMDSRRLDVEPMVVTQKGRRIYRWVVRDVDRLAQEPQMPGFTEVGPYLHISTFQDWDALGKWYARFIADQWELTPDVKAKVAQLTAGLATQEEKARAIHRWVVQQTHYVGLEFGVHGYRPYKARQIFERRFGDCKDKALLMTAMMREAGVEASMVLVRTRDNGEIDPQPASLAIFNHAICYLPGLKLFLDGTAEYSGLRELPYQDQGVWVLVVSPDGKTERMKTPEDSPESNRYRASYEIAVPPSGGDAAVRASVSVEGQECAWIRRRYQDRDKLKETLEKDLAGSYPGTRLEKVDITPLDDLRPVVTLTYEGTLGQMARPDGKDRVSLPIWMGGLSLSNSYASLKDRVYPVEIEYPWTQSNRTVYRLPPGASAEPPQAVSLETPFGSVIRQATQEGDAVSVVLRVTISCRVVEPRDYPAFRDFCKQVDQTVSERLRIRLEGGQP